MYVGVAPRALSREERLTPSRILVLSFLGLIALGTLMLASPFSVAPGHHVGLVDALFTSTSAVCVTGLTSLDTEHDFSRSGQVAILALIQLGGLGISLFSTSLLLLLGGRLGLRGRIMVQEHLPGLSLSQTGHLTRHIVWFFLGCEALGALCLWVVWMPRFGPAEALYHGVFHSVSAFCNAGFSTFSENLARDVANGPANVVIMLLIIGGGLGYLVCSEAFGCLVQPGWRGRTSVYTWLVLTSTVVLIVGGAAMIILFEYRNPETLGPLSWPVRALAALFQSVTCRTAGFNTLSIGKLHEETLQLMMMLMFVGGSPGSTAGGIKNTTFALLVLAAWAQLHGQENVEIRGRRIPRRRVAQALSLTMVAATVVAVVTILLNYVEEFQYNHLLFEVVSALGTVGLSTGVTPSLSSFSKILLCLAMFVGRVGPMTLAASLLSSSRPAVVRCPPADIIIG